MKHVFVIHSHTVFLTAMGVVEYLKLNNADVIFLYSRNYSNSLFQIPFKVLDVSGLTNIQTDLYKSKSQRNALLSKIDTVVSTIINDDFELYVPHFAMAFCQALYTNARCLRGAYIQEGGVVYSTAYKTRFSFFERIKYFIKNTFILRTNRVWSPACWYVSGKLIKQDHIDSFSISDNYFKFLPSINHIIKWPEFIFDCSKYQDSVIFIFDAFVKNNILESDYYLRCCKQMVEKYSLNRNYVKFHPGQSTEERVCIESFFKGENLNYEIMVDEVPFEIILSNSNNLNIVGFGSSLLFFAKDLGHNVVCADRMLGDSLLYQNYKSKFGLMYFDELYK